MIRINRIIIWLVPVLLVVLGGFYSISADAASVIASPVVDPQRSRLQLPAGNQVYVYGMATGGAAFSSPFVSGQYASAMDADGNVAAEIGLTTRNTDQFSTGAGYYVVGGVGISGFQHVREVYASNNVPGASSATANFSLSGPALVVFVALPGGETYANLVGVPGLQIDADSANQPGVIPMIIAHAYLGKGAYSVTEETSGDSGQNLSNEADLIGVFIFSGSAAGVGSNGRNTAGPALVGIAQNGRVIATDYGIQVATRSAHWCGQTASLMVRAPHKAVFEGAQERLQGVIGVARSILEAECPQVGRINLMGDVRGTTVYRGYTAAAGHWVLVSETPLGVRARITKIAKITSESHRWPVFTYMVAIFALIAMGTVGIVLMSVRRRKPSEPAPVEHSLSSGASSVPSGEVRDPTCCPSCGHQGKKGVTFCAQCGEAMGTVRNDGKRLCSSCGAESLAGAKFCKGCGKPL